MSFPAALDGAVGAQRTAPSRRVPCDDAAGLRLTGDRDCRDSAWLVRSLDPPEGSRAAASRHRPAARAVLPAARQRGPQASAGLPERLSPVRRQHGPRATREDHGRGSSPGDRPGDRPDPFRPRRNRRCAPATWTEAAPGPVGWVGWGRERRRRAAGKRITPPRIPRCVAGRNTGGVTDQAAVLLAATPS